MERDQEIKNINIEEIIPNRFQPRLSFEPEALRELSESIKQYGVFQPLVVRRVGNKYEIIAGERRYKASTQAGFKEVPCVIVDLDDNESAEIALVENLQRKDLTPLEEAKSYQKLLERGYINQDQLAKRMGKSQSNIANKIRLLNLDEDVQQALLESKISERHARSLLSIKDKEIQKTILNKIIENRMTVRDTDAEVKRMLNEDKQTLDFIPIRPEIEEVSVVEPFDQPEINIENTNEEPNIEEIPTVQTLSEPEVSIEKLIKAEPDVTENQAKLDIMDLLKVEEVKTYDQPAEIKVEPEQEDLAEEIKNVPGDQIPPMMDNPLPEVLLQSFSNSEQATEQLAETHEEIQSSPTIEQSEPIAEQPEEITIQPQPESIESNIPVMGQNIETPFIYENPQQPNFTPEEQPLTTNEQQPKAGIYFSNNLRTAINAARDCANTIEKFGFHVEKEELDLTDSYQITITIAKTDV